MNDTDFTQRDRGEARASRNLDFRQCGEEKAENAIRHLEKAKRYDVSILFYLLLLIKSTVFRL